MKGRSQQKGLGKGAHRDIGMNLLESDDWGLKKSSENWGKVPVLREMGSFRLAPAPFQAKLEVGRYGTVCRTGSSELPWSVWNRTATSFLRNTTYLYVVAPIQVTAHMHDSLKSYTTMFCMEWFWTWNPPETLSTGICPDQLGEFTALSSTFYLDLVEGFQVRKKDTKGRRVNLTKGEGKRGKKKGKAKKGRGRTRFSTGTFIFALPVLLLNNF